jgi:hypothetical protein
MTMAVTASGRSRATADPAAGWSHVWQAARQQLAPDPSRPLWKFQGGLQAIHDRLHDGERILEIRITHRGALGRATGAMALTTCRLLVADASRASEEPVAESVPFSEISRVSCRRVGWSGVTLSVRTRSGRRFRGVQGKDAASARRFVAAARAAVAEASPAAE